MLSARREHDVGIIAQRRNGFKAHVSGALRAACSTCLDNHVHSDDPNDAEPEKNKRQHGQLHICKNNPPSMLLVEASNAGISGGEWRERCDREAEPIDKEHDKREMQRRGTCDLAMRSLTGQMRK
jgi:hypothetical protein